MKKLKDLFYFPVAGYFAFFAKIRLKKWGPRIIVITGSSGKTTLLHLLKSQMGKVAKYSHKANSSFGIPFDLLDLHRKTLTLGEWPKLFLMAPFRAFRKTPQQNLYVVEVDCDRPHEGEFLGSLLKPEVVLWLNSSRTHSMNFESLVDRGVFKDVDEAIAYEFGNVAVYAQRKVIVNADSENILSQIGRVNAEVVKISCSKSLESYDVVAGKTKFSIRGKNYNFDYLLPIETCTQILMTEKLLKYLKIKPDSSFSKFKLPPGRSTLFKGIKNTALVDSTYNSSFDSMRAILNMFAHVKANNKWIVLGDMLEQGGRTGEEHNKLASLLSKYRFKKIILMGPRVTRYTYPRLKKLIGKRVVVECFMGPKEVLDYLRNNIKGGETVLFKGARFLEGVIENLLYNKKEVKYLARREKVWEKRRKKWGL